MQQSYELIDIERIIREGIYIKDIQFNTNKKNIQRIIDYLEKLKPNQDSLTIVISIIKFYRFPTVLCFAPLYDRIQKLPADKQQQIKPELLEIAALVSSFLRYLHQEHFKEIKFYFRWGVLKKKYRFQMAKSEIEFAEFIIKLSNMKAEIERLAETLQKKQVKIQKINEFLSLQMQRQLNPFEDYFINFIRKQSGPSILKIQDQEEEQPQNKKKKQILKSTQEKQSQDKNRNQPIKNSPLPNLKDFPSLLQKSPKNRVNLFSPKPTVQPSFDRQESQQNSVSNSNILANITINRKPFQLYQDQCVILPKREQKQLTPLCCRPCFYENQTIQQPENLRIQYKFYNFPFSDKKDQLPTKKQKIKRTLCGFLNAQGGTIYFGIKETDNKQRLVFGMFVTQNQKIQFRKTIFKLLEEIQPDVGKRCQIKWVPLRSRNTDNYISGKYVAKVTIERGDKDQVYSYEQFLKNGKYQQKFAFKTENQVLVKSNPQQILRIFKTKIEQPPRPFYPVHSYPCKEPEIGKQVIGDNYLEQREERDYNHYNSCSPRERGNRQKIHSSEPFKDQLGDKLVEQTAQIRQRKKYMQKDTNQFIVKSNSQKDIQIELRKIGYILMDIKQLAHEPAKIFYVKLVKADKQLQSSATLKLIKIYGRLSYRKLTTQQCQILQMIVPQYKQLNNQDMRNRQDKILLFTTALDAAKFYVQLHDMDIYLQFTALA